MNNMEQIINDLKGIFTKAQQRYVNIEYSDSCGGQIELTASDKVFKDLDNEDSKLFSKFINVIDTYDLNYDFKSYGYIEIYEE